MKRYRRNDDVIKKFGLNVRKVRKGKGITQEELADLTNIDYRNIGRIERGEINSGLSIVACIADALKVKVSDLLDF